MFTTTYVNMKKGQESNLVQSTWPLDGKGDQAITDAMNDNPGRCSLLNVNRGRTTIEGETYCLVDNLSSHSYKLKKLDGGGRVFDVVNLSINAYSDSDETSMWGVYDASTIASSYLNSKFSVVQIGDDRCLEYKSSTAVYGSELNIVTADVVGFDQFISDNLPSGADSSAYAQKFYPDGVATVWTVDSLAWSSTSTSSASNSITVGPNMWVFPSKSDSEVEKQYFVQENVS